MTIVTIVLSYGLLAILGNQYNGLLAILDNYMKIRILSGILYLAFVLVQNVLFQLTPLTQLCCMLNLCNVTSWVVGYEKNMMEQKEIYLNYPLFF